MATRVEMDEGSFTVKAPVEWATETHVCPDCIVDPLTKHLDEVVNTCWNYAGRCKTDADHLQNAVLGLTGEAGEVADNIKKMLYHTEGKDYREKIKHELGDVFFYLIKTVDLLDFTVEEILAANREKLESRHPEMGKVEERFGDGYIK